MTEHANIKQTSTAVVWNSISWFFGIVFLTIGIINLFWGNDPGFGAFIIFLSFLYFPPLTNILTILTKLPIPWYIKVFVGFFILWSSLGVGELFEKIHLMMIDLSQ
jgi:hypothetical protein